MMSKKSNYTPQSPVEDVLLPAIKTFAQECWINNRWNDDSKNLSLKKYMDLETLIYYAIDDCMKIIEYIEYYNKRNIIAARELCEAFNHIISKGYKFPLRHENSLMLLHDRLNEVMKAADKKLIKENIKREKEQKQILKLPKKQSGRR